MGIFLKYRNGGNIWFMKVEIDQSGRIEETNRNTIVGLANKEISFTALIPAKIKRQLLEEFREQGKPKIFPIVIFAHAVLEIIKRSHLGITDLVIDVEYPGHEGTIANIINSGLEKEIDISFKSIGKKSKAHYVAYGVFTGRNKPDVKLGLKDFYRCL